MSFYSKRDIKEWIGLITRSEHVYFERWHIPITVLDPQPTRRHSTGSQRDSSVFKFSSSPDSQPEETEIDPAAAYRSAYDFVTKAIIFIIDVSLILLKL